MNKLLLIGVLLMFFVACEKDQIGRYDLERYVYFTNTQEQDTMISFSYYPGEDRHSLQFEVNLTGELLDEPLAYKLEIVDSLTTATPEMYDVDLNPKFGSGKSKDTLTITLVNHLDLKDKEVALVVAIVPNENFEPGFVGKRYVKIYYNDLDSKPLWWDATFSIYFGDYTATKFKTLVACSQKNDFTGVEETLLRKYALELKAYIQKEGITEPDGSAIVIPVY